MHKNKYNSDTCIILLIQIYEIFLLFKTYINLFPVKRNRKSVRKNISRCGDVQ